MPLEHNVDIRLEYERTRWEIEVNVLQTPPGTSELNPVHLQTETGLVCSRVFKPQIQDEDFKHGSYVYICVTADDIIPQNLKEIIHHYQEYAGGGLLSTKICNLRTALQATLQRMPPQQNPRIAVWPLVSKKEFKEQE